MKLPLFVNEPYQEPESTTGPMRERQKFAVSTLVFIGILILFIAVSGIIAFRLREGIAPDESAHFAFTKLFATTLGLPNDTPETVAIGWQIHHNPFLYHWIAGRVVQILTLLRPTISDRTLLVALRLMSVLMSAVSLVFLYLTSKLLIRNKWLQLLPVFMLLNTLMYIFLSGAVSYDNLANLFSFIAIYFFTLAFKGKDFTGSTILMIISIGLACLVKYSVLPLAFGLVVWSVFFVIRRKNEQYVLKFEKKQTMLILLSVVIVATNIALYGYNLVVYRSLTPTCEQMVSGNLCQTSVYTQRFKEIALPSKLTISESIKQGFPDPVEYVFYSWIPNLLYRIYGILAHLSYFPPHIVVLFYILYIFYFVLGVKEFPEKPSAIYIVFATIIILFCVVILRMNYNDELVYGFKQIGMHGRYLFPVIGIFYILIGKILEKGRRIKLSGLLRFCTVALFLYSGPLSLLIHYTSAFKEWFL